MSRDVKVGIAILVIIVVVIFVAGNTSRRTPTASPVESAFNPGGALDLDLSAGNYTIRGSTDNKIHVEYTTNNSEELASVSLKADGSHARLSVAGPSSHFRCEISVPQKTNLSGHLTAGRLQIAQVEGNKDIDANAGLLDIDVGDPATYRTVVASVVSGNLQARAWSERHSGLFPRFSRHSSQGSYNLHASLLAGNLVLR